MKKIINGLILGLLSFVILTTSVSAGTVSVSSSYSSVYVGNSVVVTVKAPDVAGKFSVTSNNTNVLSGGSASSWIEGTVTYTFYANSVGTATVNVVPIDAADYSGNVYSSAKSVTISVITKKVVVLSSDNALTSLSIDGNTINPTFSADTLEYSVELAPGTTEVNVVATASSNVATISGNGVRQVTDGDNSLEVTVTAENGTSRTYKIKATVKEYDPIEVEYDGVKYTVVRKKTSLTAPTNYTETTVKIKDIEVPAFKSDITKYILVGLKDAEGNISLYVYDSTKSSYEKYNEFSFSQIKLYTMESPKDKIIKGYTKTEIKYGDKTFIAYKKDTTDDYALIYAMNLDTGEIAWYSYEQKEGTVQIYNNEELVTLNKTNELYFKIIIGLGVLSSLLFISLIIVIIKKSKNNKKEHKKESKSENKNEELLDGISESKESKINNLLFDEEETRSEKNMDLADTKELKRLAKQTKKEEIKKAKEDKILEKKRLKEEKKNKNKVKVTKIKFDDEGSL